MWKFQGSIRKEAEFPGVFKEKNYVEFPWVLAFDLGIPRGITEFCWISSGESFSSLEFIRVKSQI